MTPVGKEILLSARVAGLARALRELGAEAAAQTVTVPSGEPACHWYFVAAAGADLARPDPEAPFGHGTSFASGEEALSRAFGEFAERYMLGRDDRVQLVRASYPDLKSRGVRCLDPRSVAGLSDEFRHAHLEHRFDEETVFAWVAGRTFPFWQKILVPAQLVYVPYSSGRGEPRIRQPLTTGAAFGWSLAEALWRGFAEVIERDAFMITWLVRLAPARIELSDMRDPVVRRILADYASIGVEAHAFDITTDAGVPTVLAVLLDRTGNGPAVIVGCRTSFDTTLALRDAFRQAHNVRAGAIPSVRAWREAGSPAVEIKDSIPNRILFWSPTERINEVKFLFAAPPSSRRPEHQRRTSAFGVSSLISLFHAWRGLPASFGEPVVVDLTPAALKPCGRVVKVILPGAQPLHLSETFPNVGGTRWRRFAQEPNSLPHPFI